MAKPNKLPSGRYRVRYTDTDGLQRTWPGTFATYTQAKAKLVELEGEVVRGDHVAPAADLTVAEWAAEFYPTEFDLRPQTALQNQRTWRNHIAPKWGDRLLNDITQGEVSRWLTELAKQGRLNGEPMAPLSLNQVRGQFSKLMGAALVAGKLRRPVMPPKRRRRGGPASLKQARFLDDEEVLRLAAAIDDRFYLIILVGCYSGLRIRELLALRPMDLDARRRCLMVTRAQVDLAGQLSYAEVKTAKGHRSVPLNDDVYLALEEHIRANGIGPRDLIFTTDGGHALRLENFRRRYFDQAVRYADLAPFTPHDMRHTAASLFISEGANPWMLADMLGHADTRMIDKVYGHLFPKDREDFRQRMSHRVRQATIGAIDNVVPLRRADTSVADAPMREHGDQGREDAVGSGSADQGPV